MGPTRFNHVRSDLAAGVKNPVPRLARSITSVIIRMSAGSTKRGLRWRIEAYRAPDLRFAIFATNGTTESAPLWLFGMAALARWLMSHAISLDDLETV